MNATTGVSWCHATFDPWKGARLAERWERQADAAGERRRVFVAVGGDIFDKNVVMAELRCHLFQLMGRTPHLDWLLLTKRPEAVESWALWAGYWTGSAGGDAAVRVARDMVIPNVWVGVPVENQAQADERIPQLLRIPAAVRFLDCEPLLGRIEFSDVTRRSDAVQQLGKKALSGIGWVTVAGETGKQARPMHPDWARGLRDQCQAAGVPFFFRHWGEWAPLEVCAAPAGPWTPIGIERATTDIHIWPGRNELSFRIGKLAAGRLLDGREWNEFPRTEARTT